MTPVTPRLTDEELVARMRAIHWWHSIPLRAGVTTLGRKPADLMEQEEEAILAPFDFTGRSVIDIGAWNGFFSFAVKQRGAARVLATDSYTWTHPYWRGHEGFELARAELGIEIESRLLDPTVITPELGVFDIVLFLGVFYHLHDPIDVMQRLRAITGQLLLLETHQDIIGDARPGMVFYPGSELNKDATNWWGPNPAMMLKLLRDLGFSRIFYRDHPTCGRGRGIYAAGTPEMEETLMARLGAPWRDLQAPSSVTELVLES